MQRKLPPQLIAVVALVLFLVLAYGLDMLILRLKQANSVTFTLTMPLLWVYVLSELLVALGFLWLGWYVLTLPRRGYLSALYLVLGLLVILSPVFYYSPLHSTLGAALSPGALFFTAGALSAATGILTLILPNQQAEKL